LWVIHNPENKSEGITMWSFVSSPLDDSDKPTQSGLPIKKLKRETGRLGMAFKFNKDGGYYLSLPHLFLAALLAAVAGLGWRRSRCRIPLLAATVICGVTGLIGTTL
jgi:hypothetical protein